METFLNSGACRLKGGYLNRSLPPDVEKMRRLSAAMLSSVAAGNKVFESYPVVSVATKLYLGAVSEAIDIVKSPFFNNGQNGSSPEKSEGGQPYQKRIIPLETKSAERITAPIDCSGKDQEERNFVVKEILPLNGKTNGKTVVLISGLGTAAEAYFRIGGKDSILFRLLERGFKVLILDAPGMGKNESYSSTNNNIETMVEEVLPALEKYLREQKLFVGGLYFLVHSLGGLELNIYLSRNPRLSEDNNKLFKNIMTLESPEFPLPDSHPMYPLLMASLPFLSPFLSSIPYHSFVKLLEKGLPGRLLVGNCLSPLSFKRDTPLPLIRETFERSIKDFPVPLGADLVRYLWRGRFPFDFVHPTIFIEGQRQVKLVGRFDPLAPEEGLFLRLTESAETIAHSMLIGISGNSDEDVARAVSLVGEAPILGIVADEISHVDGSTANAQFDTKIWPIVLRFLDEAA